MRMKEIYMIAQELVAEMEDGSMTMDEAVEELLGEFDITSKLAYDILDICYE